MNLALSELTWTTCLVYLDDIIIWAPSFKEHLRRLRLVFDRIRTAGLKLKPTKCQFLKREVSFLGHVVSSEGIKTDPDKVETVRTWPTSVDIKELQSFLSLASYYRRFNSGFSIIVEPLYKFSRKGVSFQWQLEQESAFNELKYRLTIAPVLAFPDFSPDAGLFVLDIDASQHVGIGAVLSQLQPDGIERVINYGSRSLNEHEKSYCATRLEMLALVSYMDHFRYYLLGRKFRPMTDHHSLVWLMSFKEPQGQVARWLERLQEYDYEIQHHPGRLHNNADALSTRPRRQHGNCLSCTPTGLSQVAAVTRDLPASETPSEVRNYWSPKVVAKAQRDDPDISVVPSHLLKEWRKPAVEELQSMSCATRAVWA